MSSFLGGYASSASSKDGNSDGNESDSSNGSGSGEGIGLKKFKPINFDEPIKNSVFVGMKEAADKKKEETGQKEAENTRKRVLLPPQIATKRKNLNIDRLADRVFENEESAVTTSSNVTSKKTTTEAS